MSTTLTTFLFEAANFLVLAAVLSWLFFNPVRQALANRRAQLESEEREATEKLAQAEREKLEMDAARSQLQEELNQLRSRELESARQEVDRMLADARAATERELEQSRRQAARWSETQQERLAQVAAVAAADAVGQLLKQIGGPELHAALIESACQQLRQLSQHPLAPVKVESAQPLSLQERAALDEALGPAAASADYRTIANLGVGMRVATAQGLIDASASGLAVFARHALVKEMNHRANQHHRLQYTTDV